MTEIMISVIIDVHLIIECFIFASVLYVLIFKIIQTTKKFYSFSFLLPILIWIIFQGSVFNSVFGQLTDKTCFRTNNQLPYNCNFSTDELFSAWTILNCNNDDKTWNRTEVTVSGAKIPVAEYRYSSNVNADDWLITPSFQLEAGKSYRLKFDMRSNGSGNPEKMKITAGKMNTVEAQTIAIADFPSIINSSFETHNVEIKVSESADYCFGFYCYSDKNKYYLDITNITFEVYPEKDLEALSLIGLTLLKQDKEFIHKVVVHNNGCKEQNNFQVQIIDEMNIILGETTVTEPLIINEQRDVEIKWIPSESGNKNIYGRTLLNYDSNMDNDKSLPFKVIISTPQDADWVEIGSADEKVKNQPFNLQFKTNVTQNIYLSQEIGKENGSIEKIIYSYENKSTTEISDKKIKIYLGNVTGKTLEKGWIPKKDLVLVYEGYLNLPHNETFTVITLDKPFTYVGGDLCVMTEGILHDKTYSNVSFDITNHPDKPNRLRIYNDDKAAFDFSQNGILIADETTDIKIAIQTNADISKELEAFSVSGRKQPVMGKQYSYKVKIRNNGSAMQNNYVIQLIDNDDNIISTADVVKEILPGESKDIELKWSPTSAGNIGLRGKVILPGDINIDNNISEIFDITVQDSGSDEWVEIGKRGSLVKNQPINYYYHTSVTQTIFLENEIEIKSGVIQKIAYFYDNKSGNDIIDKKLKVYMCRTSMSSMENSWIAQNEMALVFDGNVSLKQNENKVEIILTNPFLYNGGNLCIMIERVFDEDNFNNVEFYVTEDTDFPNRTRIFQSDFETFDFSQNGHLQNNVSDIDISFKVDGGGSITGIIYDQQEIIEGVKVEIRQNKLESLSNNKGRYEFGYLPGGSYKINASKIGYYDFEKEGIIVEAENITNEDITLTAIPSYKIKGKILDVDGNFISDAKVTLEGYVNYNVISNQNGEFEFSSVYISQMNYVLAVSKKGFEDYSSLIKVSDGDVSLDDIVLKDFMIPPVNVIAEENGGNMIIKWENGEAKSLKGFNVYRLAEKDKPATDKWILLTASPLNINEFTDNQWSGLESGVYLYGVKSVYSQNKESDAAFSALKAKDMLASVTVKTNTNTSENESSGAIIKLINNDGNLEHIYQQTVESSFEAVFEQVWKGVYDISIELDGFKPFTKSGLDFTSGNSHIVDLFILNEIIISPYNLLINHTDIETERLFTWNTSITIEDDFERHDDFAINSPGYANWSYMDGDDANTAGFAAIQFPNRGKKMAYIIFNPSQTDPVMSEDMIKPHSGKKVLASFCAEQKQNDDYIISDELNFTEDFIFSFYAKSYNDKYGLEKINVLYCVDGKNITDFKSSNNFPIEVPADKWTEYSFTVPKNAKHVAIQCVSNNVFMLMIDDIRISAEQQRKLKKYEVYLNNRKVSETSENIYKFTNLKKGTYSAGVLSVYSSGNSEMSSVKFDVDTDGIISYNNDNLKTWPNPVNNDILNISITNWNPEKIMIYDNWGKLIMQYEYKDILVDGRMIIDTYGMPNGIYIIKAIAGEQCIHSKFIIAN